MLRSQSLKGVKGGGDCQSWKTWDGAYEQAVQNIRGIIKSFWGIVNCSCFTVKRVPEEI